MPTSLIGLWQQGQSGGGSAVGAVKGGCLQSSSAKMRSHLFLAAALSQPK